MNACTTWEWLFDSHFWLTVFILVLIVPLLLVIKHKKSPQGWSYIICGFLIILISVAVYSGFDLSFREIKGWEKLSVGECARFFVVIESLLSLILRVIPLSLGALGTWVFVKGFEDWLANDK